MDGIGKSVRQFVEGQAADLTMQLQQQILGCINTAIRDLMNKYPEIDFILNFEDRINGILGNFRNKLERKIDAELRKLAYNKIKIHTCKNLYKLRTCTEFNKYRKKLLTCTIYLRAQKYKKI